MYIALSLIIFLVFWIILCIKSYDIIVNISWWFKKKNKDNNKLLDLKLKILSSLSKALKIKIRVKYTSHQFFEFKYKDNYFQLYFPENQNYISILNKTNNSHKSFNYYDKYLYLDILSFIEKSAEDKPKEIEVQDDYYGL